MQNHFNSLNTWTIVICRCTSLLIIDEALKGSEQVLGPLQSNKVPWILWISITYQQWEAEKMEWNNISSMPSKVTTTPEVCHNGIYQLTSSKAAALWFPTNLLKTMVDKSSGHEVDYQLEMCMDVGSHICTYNTFSKEGEWVEAGKKKNLKWWLW